jgi:hypothetical protein
MSDWKKLITSGSDASLNSVTLNPTPSLIPTLQGSIYFDEDEETLAVILNGTTQMVGEDIFFQIKNQTGTTIPKGTAVRFDGVIGLSGRVSVVPFLANGTHPSLYFLGVTSEAILDGEDGKAYANGKISNLNTDAYPIGTILYCSTTVAGGFQTTPPIAPNNIISIAAVIAQSATVGKLLIRPQLGSNINNDEGVKIVSVSNLNLLQYQSASGLWENKTLAQAGIQPTLTNPITGTGVNGQVSFFNGTTSQTGDNGLFWDNTNKRLGIEAISPNAKLDVNGNTIITGSLNVTQGITGSFQGDGSGITGINASAVGFSNNITLSADYTTVAGTYNSLHGPLALEASVTISVTEGSFLKIEDFNDILYSVSSSFAETSSFLLGSVDSASFSETSSYALLSLQSINNNASSGSLSFWQGSQTEYNLISASANPNTVYFIT